MKKGKYVRGTILSASPALSDGVAGLMPDNEAQSNSFAKKWLPILLILLITGFIYTFSLGNDTTNWDDDKYTDNELVKTLDWPTVERMFASDNPDELYFMGNYHPLTMLSLNLDYQRADLKPNGKPYPIVFIVSNIILHLICCFIIYLVFSQLFSKKIYPIVIALLFGIHTLHVESVTWISERKDVLYTMFYFLSLYCYILYKKRLNVTFYILSLIIFIFSALSKGQAVSLSITLFLIDYLISEDYLNWRTHLNKIPFLAISLVFGLISINAQASSTALAETDQYELYQRIAFGSNGFIQYIMRFALPLKLANLYPYPDIINRTVPVIYWLCVPLFVAVALLSFFIYKKHKVVTFGLMFFIVNIALLLQFIPVGSAMYSDRYIYIPSVGLSVLVACLLDFLIGKYKEMRNVFYIIFSIYSLLLCYLTIQREKVWHDSGTLWSDCLSKYPEAVIGWNNYGSFNNMIADSLYRKTDDSKFIEYKKKAIDCFTSGIKYKPDYVHSFFNRGLAAKDLYDLTSDTAYLRQALDDYNNAICFNLNFAPAFQNRALIYDLKSEKFMGEGRSDSASFYTNLAISDYNRAIDLDPSLVEVYMNRGTTYGKSGNYAKCIEDFNTFLTYRPNTASLYSNMGLAHNGLKMYDKALEDFGKSIQLDSTSENAYYNRSITYRILGDSLGDSNYYTLAAADLSKCISMSPQKGMYYYQRGIYRRLLNSKQDACDDFSKAFSMNYEPAKYFIDNYCSK